MKKLIDDTIGVNQRDLGIFLRLLSAYANEKHMPYLVDASQTVFDHLFDVDTDIKSDFQAWSGNQIKFK
jgi:hypothetical protein